MKISVILPTRRRVSRLQNSVHSLQATCAAAELEFLLGLDDDDDESLGWLNSDRPPGVFAAVGPRVGYGKLHLYVNALAGMATGDWLLLWNDDAIMSTKGWDEVVNRFSGQIVVLNPQTNHDNQARSQCIFPILPKAYVETLGHVSLSNHYDTYVEWTANELGLRRDVPIFVLHERPDLTGAQMDLVYEERQITTDDFFGPKNRALIAKDVAKLRGFLAGR